jgi:hypothetical protein
LTVGVEFVAKDMKLSLETSPEAVKPQVIDHTID